MAGKNLASKYSSKVDERFTKVSQASMALNNDYEFTGVDTVKVFSIPVVPMGNYSRSGSNRYGTPSDLQRNVQTMKINRDRSFSFVIDKGDKIQSQMVSDAGKALSRQINEVWIPEYDAYVFRTLAHAATVRGGFSDKAITKANAYECFLAGQEWLGDHNVPDTGRVAFCSYKYANFLKQDPAFMRYGDKSQDMLIKGVIGEVDGTKIAKVPSSRLPAGCAFILTHPSAATAPKQLEDYKIHDNPPGINGWLVEGRCIYDCFVLDEKADAVYYHGSQGVLKALTVMTAPGATGTTQVIIITEPEGNHTFAYKTFAGNAAPEVTYGTAITVGGSGNFTAVTSGTQISVPEGHDHIMVVEIDSEKKPIGAARAGINVG